MSDEKMGRLVELLAEVLPPRPTNLDSPDCPSYTMAPLAIEQLHIRFDMLVEALSAHGLPVVDELARFKRALAEYPFKNRQQLQAHKVCKGVIELAASYAGDAK